MKNKVYILISFYYSLFVLSSCCENSYYWIEFNEVEVHYENSYNVAFTIKPKNETIKQVGDLLKDGVLAGLKNFKSANAFGSCRQETFYSFEKKIINCSITSNLSFKDSIMAGEDLRGLFVGQFSPIKNNYENQLGTLELIQSDTSYIERDLYLTFEFDNGDTLRDTLQEVVLLPVSPDM